MDLKKESLEVEEELLLRIQNFQEKTHKHQVSSMHFLLKLMKKFQDAVNKTNKKLYLSLLKLCQKDETGASKIEQNEQVINEYKQTVNNFATAKSNKEREEVEKVLEKKGRNALKALQIQALEFEAKGINLLSDFLDSFGEFFQTSSPLLSDFSEYLNEYKELGREIRKQADVLNVRETTVFNKNLEETIKRDGKIPVN